MAIPARPSRIGPFEIVAKIAGGGMAMIYLGRDTTDPERRAVAVKVVRHDLSLHPDVVTMFHDEAKILTMLSHPNLTHTLRAGSDANQHFIAMELMLGCTLGQLWDRLVARQEAIPLYMAAWIAARVGEGLHFAHDLRDEKGEPLGLVHRDVNPSNVFLGFDGQVKLFDFGLAKAIGARVQTATNIVKGKLPYLAPEQVMQFPLDRRVDVFSLGTTLWELLTMRRLFKREDDGETLNAVQRGPIPSARAVVPDVPEPIARVCACALERNRDHRFATSLDFAHALDATIAPDVAREMPLRVGEMIDRTFPTERRRQMGWLKPSR